MITDRLRRIIRRCLPAPVRKPLGFLHGKFLEHIGAPALGLVFDLAGGRFRANGCEFKIPKDATKLGFRACFLSDKYEIDERKLVLKLVHADDAVLELGACMGIVSCITNKVLRDPVRHVVVEANPFCLPSLHLNRATNGCRFLVEHCAVSNEKDITFFLHPKYIVGSSAHVTSGVPVRVPGRSLINLTERHGPFTVLIMDIEGSELECLRSSRRILGDFRLVLIELHDWVIGTEGVAECREILRQAGFEMVERSFVTEAWRKA